MNKSGKIKTSIIAFIKTIKLIIKLHPQTLIWMVISSLVASANIMVNIYIPKLVIDYVMTGRPLQSILRLIIILFLIKIILYYLEEISNQRANHEQGMVIYKLQKYFSYKVNNIKYEYLESPEILELKEAAQAPLNQGTVYVVLLNISRFLNGLFTVLGIITVLIQFSLALLVIVTLLSLLSTYIVAKLFKAKIEMQRRLIPINMRYSYYFQQFTDEKKQKEFRTYGNNLILIEKINRLNAKMLNELMDVAVISANSLSLGSVFKMFGRFLIYSYSGLRLLGILGTKVSLANFSLLIQANENYGKSIEELGLSMYEILGNITLLEPIFNFLALEEINDKNKTKVPGDLEVLEFENVSFSYPQTDKKILDKLSFKINKGERVALVGRNNSGKSTIVKLICRLFDPDEGRILWNGVDIRDFSYKKYLKELSTVFQDFKLFPVSIWENVTTQIEEPENEESIKAKVMEIIEEVNLDEKINELPDGLDTKLDKIIHEDATELSGGQEQKLAIARAVYQDSSLAILDEPTAALDPLAEAEVYGHFDRFVKNKTAIFISHRMSASRFCDRILVLEDGKITGNGDHENMIKNNNLYKSLYDAQAQYYV